MADTGSRVVTGQPMLLWPQGASWRCGTVSDVVDAAGCWDIVGTDGPICNCAKHLDTQRAAFAGRRTRFCRLRAEPRTVAVEWPCAGNRIACGCSSGASTDGSIRVRVRPCTEYDNSRASLHADGGDPWAVPGGCDRCVSAADHSSTGE